MLSRPRFRLALWALFWVATAACGATSEASLAESSGPPAEVAPQPEPVAEPEPQPSLQEAEEAMTLDRMDAILRQEGLEVTRQDNMWEAVVDGVRIAVVTDPLADRMRIIAPVAADADLTDDLRRVLLAANFHTALDARYAIGGGVLYAAFIHPLSPLSDLEFRSALHQVAQLKLTFGTTFSSGEMIFGGTRAP